MKLNDISLKVGASFAALIVLLGTMGLLALNRMTVANALSQELQDFSWHKVELSRQALHYSALNSRLTMEIFITTDRHQIDAILKDRTANTQKITQLVTELESLSNSSEEEKLLADIRVARKPYVDGYLHAIHLLLDENQPEAARSEMNGVVLHSLIAYHDAWEQFVNFQGQRMSEAEQTAKENFRQARILAQGLLSIAIVLALSIAAYVIWKMTREIARRQRAEHALAAANLVLETRVEERTAELAHTNVELRKAQERLIQTSRQAGMAEVANGVLHNIGNVLNSVNVSTSVIGEKLQGFPVADLAKAAEMIDKHREDLAQFLTADTRGRHLPDYLSEVAKLLGRENAALLEELSSLTHGVDHIKQIVQMQQSYAKVSTLREPVNPASLIDDAIRLNLLSLERHNIRIERHLADIEMVNIDRHKILQILTNLISNAKNALKDAHTAEGSAITINLDRIELNGSEAIRFQVIDNGVGIPAENMERIFSHGFTTRDNGHGFGLHSSINAAREMGGSLTAASDGPGRGATFTLDIPTGAEAAIAK